MVRLLLRAVRTLHFVAASAVGGLLLPVVSAAAIAVAFVRGPEGRAAVFAARTYSRLMQRVLGWRIEAEGLERLTGRPSVVMPRHQSNLDVVVLGEVYPPGAVAIGKKEVTRIPLFGWLWTVTGNFLVDRSDLPKAISSMQRAAERARAAGLSVWVAPEGHRNANAILLPFKKGAFHLAVGLGFPIVPVAIEPLSTVIDAARWVVRPGRVRLRVLPPISTEGLGPSDVDALAERVRDALQRAQDELAATAREPILPG